MDYNEILPQLFIGSHPATRDDIDRLKRELGADAILSLQTDEDLRACGVRWPELEAHYARRGIELRRAPVRDFNAVDLQAKLPLCVRTLDELLRAGHRTYMHCTAGAGRAPSVAIAYLVWCHGLDLDKAVAHVTCRRRCSPNVEAIRLATQRKSPYQDPSQPPLG